MKKTFKAQPASILFFGSIVMASAKPRIAVGDFKTFDNEEVSDVLTVVKAAVANGSFSSDNMITSKPLGGVIVPLGSRLLSQKASGLVLSSDSINFKIS